MNADPKTWPDVYYVLHVLELDETKIFLIFFAV